MSCREIERLFSEGASEADRRAHAAGCRECETLGRDAASGETLSAGLVPPAWSASLRQSLLSIPARTVDCEAAADMIARLMEADAGMAAEPSGALSPADLDACRRRLDRNSDARG